MWNPFRRRNKLDKSERQLHSLAYVFAVANELSRRGLVHWHGNGTLLIEESLATLQMARGENDFRRFLNNLVQWEDFCLMCDTYNRRCMDAELCAIREAQRKSKTALSQADRHRIRMLARSQLSDSGIDEMNLVQEFDIFIIRATATNAREATVDNGELIAVGHYDGKRVEMALYDEIKSQLHHEEK